MATITIVNFICARAESLTDVATVTKEGGAYRNSCCYRDNHDVITKAVLNLRYKPLKSSGVPQAHAVLSNPVTQIYFNT